tara:strand:+ start:1928 stop:4048 length:2121 start_codon:yes stop_codon:yes gene_type:complete
MAKINTKTFRGGSIPAWALEGYQSESANYADVVRSITSAYDNQQQRNLQEQRINQQQEQFDETFEYNKQQNLIEQNLKKEDLIFQKNEARKKAVIEADNRTYIKELNEANAFKDNYDVMSDTLGPDIDGLDARLNILNSGDKFNPIIGDYVKSKTVGLNRSKEQWTATSNNVRDIIFPGRSDEELRDSGQDGVLKMYTNGLLKGGKGGDRLFELMLSRAVPELSPDSRIKNKEIITELEGIVELEMTYSGEGENPYTSMREALTTKLQSNIIGVQPEIQLDSIYNNDSILEDYGDSKGISLPEVKANIADGTLSNEDLDEYFAGKDEEKTGLIDSLSDYLGNVASGVPTIGRYLSREDTSAMELAKDNPLLTGGMALAAGAYSPILAPIAGTLALASATKEERSELADTTLAQLSKVGDMAKDFAYLSVEKVDPAMQKMADFANDKFSKGVTAISEARGPKLALLRGMQVMSTVPHRALEAFNFQRNPDIKKYIDEGMNPDDAIDQAYKDAISRGGNYFTTSFMRVGEDAPPEFLYKKQLIDYSKGFYKDGKMPENMAKAPSKFKNPRYIAWKTNELEKKLYQQFAKITDSKKETPSIAGGLLKNIKTKSRDIVKELIQLKKDIKKSPKIAKGSSSVSPKVINALLDKAKRLTASKSAQKVWDEFMLGAESEFDFEKEMDIKMDKISKQIEIDSLIDSLRKAPANF